MASADRLIEIFNEAKARTTGSERDGFLAESCGDDAALKAQVLSLLGAHEKAGEFLKAQPALSPEMEAELARLKPEEAGERIGPYKLREQIGEGGFGVVWVAEQQEPVRRTVALKIIKLGMDTREVVARFEQERQALAMMDHPNIARVFDAGATEHGRPYFVMELVRGIRITEYCDQANLPTAERLALFIQVCHAVQHAHQKGIIHRDLKPSNILVTLHDGVPVPKVIDFGVAKATQGRLTENTVYTQFQQMIGTPLYMSPEQAEMSGLDVDTRTDIYALGVLLYELLTGRTPFDAATFLKAGHDEMRRIIREQEPQKPSTALHTMAQEKLTSVAHHRASEPPKLIHAIHGDLDWIVMKTLEKERARRYETANGLAMDLQRHLDDEPVVARPPTNLYRFQKLVRRNKLAFAAASAVVAALVLGLGVSTWMFFKEKQARQRAVAAEQNTRTEAAKNQRITRFHVLRLQGKFAEAEQALREWMDLILKLPGQDRGKLPPILRGMAQSLLSRGKSQDAETLYEETIHVTRQKLGESSPVLSELFHSYGSFLRLEAYKPDAAAEQYLKALAIRRATQDKDLDSTLCALGYALIASGKPVDAEPYLQESLTLGRKPGHPDWVTGWSLRGLATIRINEKRFPEAERLYREELSFWEKLKGVGSDEYTGALRALVQLYEATGQSEKAAEWKKKLAEFEQAEAGKKSTDPKP